MASPVVSTTSPFPNIDNWRRFGVPPDYGATSIPEIYSDPHIGPKVVLNLMDGLLAVYAGGPQSQPNYAFTSTPFTRAKTRSRSTPSRCRQIDDWRKKHSLPAIGRTGAHIAVAEQMGLGNASPSRIVIRDVGR